MSSSQSNPQEDDIVPLISSPTAPAAAATSLGPLETDTMEILTKPRTDSLDSGISRNTTSDDPQQQQQQQQIQQHPSLPPQPMMFRSRKSGDRNTHPNRKRRKRKSHRQAHSNNHHHHSHNAETPTFSFPSSTASIASAKTTVGKQQGIFRKLIACIWAWLTRSPTVAAGTIPTAATSFAVPRTNRWMGFLARGVLWTTILSLTVAIMFYSYELFNHGTDPHLVAWFSAGAFVLMGFPICMWAIVSHLANYNQPQVQVYIVRILWMVPLYSVGSWLAMRFRNYAIYIETIRDLYESYVLYSFLQYLIHVLGGEEALVLMLKDKSPTRGVHMWGLQWCVKPWLMGQPYRKTIYERDNRHSTGTSGGSTPSADASSDPLASTTNTTNASSPKARAVKRVMWKSPFFVRCKFGCLQYVLLKFVTAISIMILEHIGWYKEGDFSPWGPYLYICFLTNLSQCWALYCLVLFYHATHNELAAIRPVGKFLSVKSLVFFTWWQSVMIAYLLSIGMIPNYSMSQQDWTPEDVAKGLQDYLICIEMFLIAIVHSFVFPHSEYSPQAVEARARALNLAPMTKWQKKRLGRSKYSSQYLLFRSDESSANSTSLGTDVETELVSLTSESEVTGWTSGNTTHFFTNESPQSNFASQPAYTDDPEMGAASDPLHSGEGGQGHGRRLDPSVVTEQEGEDEEDSAESMDDEEYDDTDSVEAGASHDLSLDADDRLPLNSGASVATAGSKHGFMQAFIESAIPSDMVDSTVGIVKGEYNIERKTLLNHATASDQYDLFSPSRRPFGLKRPKPPTKK